MSAERRLAPEGSIRFASLDRRSGARRAQVDDTEIPLPPDMDKSGYPGQRVGTTSRWGSSSRALDGVSRRLVMQHEGPSGHGPRVVQRRRSRYLLEGEFEARDVRRPRAVGPVAERHSRCIALTLRHRRHVRSPRPHRRRRQPLRLYGAEDEPDRRHDGMPIDHHGEYLTVDPPRRWPLQGALSRMGREPVHTSTLHPLGRIACGALVVVLAIGIALGWWFGVMR
jgi:hypothetical protein